MKFLLIYVPNLRFNNDPYKEYNLYEFATRITRKNKDNVSNLPLTISAQYGLVDQVSFFNKTVASKDMSGYYLLKNGEFAYNKSYSNDYPWGAIKRLDLYDMGCLSTLYICFKTNDNIVNSNYLVHYFESSKWHKQVADIAGEGARNHGLLNIAVNDFFNTKHAVPTIENQIKIAGFLDLIEERIQTQIKIIDDLLTVKNGISNKLFKLQQIELSNHYLSEYLIEGDKTAVDTSCYKKITVKLNNQGLAFSELNREMADTRPFYVRHKGELIIGKQNYFNGSIAIVTEQFDNCICSNAIMSFKIKGIYSDFLYYQISNNNYLNSQSYKANGTGQKELSEKEFLNFKIWCPQLEVQQKIVNCFKSLDLKIENEKAILNSYFREKSYLLNNMFI